MSDSTSNSPIDNRTIILECAVNLFSHRGYDAVGVQEIVLAAGVTKPTLYHYFESKKGLLAAIVLEFGQPLRNAVASASVYNHDLVFSLEQVAFAIVDQATICPQFYRMLLALYFAPSDSEARLVVMDLLLDLQHTMEELFAAAVPEHGNMRGRQAVFAATFLGMLNTWIAIYLDDMRLFDRQAIRAALKQYQHGIFS